MLESLKKNVFRIFEKLCSSSKGVSILSESVGNRIASYPQEVRKINNVASPYSTQNNMPNNSAYKDVTPVVITGRFRSGSTLLWNIFRQLEGITAFYEPLNERRWFDPTNRGESVDTTHINVKSNYWREYDGLNNHLRPLYQERWIERDLYMGEHASDWALHRYIDQLIKAAPGRPVLQFNRIDFRLPWLKRIYPKGYFIHIFRHPRDQWISTLMDPQCFGPDEGDLFAFDNADKFYLCTWVRDLQHWFPFLKDWSRHPYYHFYFIWKLSFLFGRKYCHHSIKFEDLVTQPRSVLAPLFADLEIDNPNWQRILPIITTPAMGKWKDYAAESWFMDIEAECEEEMQLYFGWERDEN